MVSRTQHVITSSSLFAHDAGDHIGHLITIR